MNNLLMIARRSLLLIALFIFPVICIYLIFALAGSFIWMTLYFDLTAWGVIDRAIYLVLAAFSGCFSVYFFLIKG